MADVIIQRLMLEAEHDDDVALLLARALPDRPQSPTATTRERFAGRRFSVNVPGDGDSRGPARLKPHLL
jgi:hypothetical protein